ncbi:MAG TPA: AMP-binding protein [Candidatus Acidoferrales bacterium]|jgi:long-chain acyl-CoA synthetase|nr:AMP-binding protein [Candidatus Acidoferrales bacterium]
MTFLERIFARLRQDGSATVLEEISSEEAAGVTGAELLELVEQARAFCAGIGLKPGDRCALLAPNSIRWAACDLALMAEGVIVVPLYTRQAPAELAAILRDCRPSRIFCGDSSLRDGLAAAWPDAPPFSLLDEVFSRPPSSAPRPLPPKQDADFVTIIYTSGTSGEPKGVPLTVGNLNHMLACTAARLDLLMGDTSEPDRVFHYLPFNFAASWILLLTCLSRHSRLSLCTDLAQLAEGLKAAAPHYFLNVPLMLERVRAKVEGHIRERGGMVAALFTRAWQGYLRRYRGEGRLFDTLWLSLANSLMFPSIRQSLGPNLKALICGSAPLALETQLFFRMVGIPVLQAYGLTETTGICTLDDPRRVEPGRVGLAVPGIVMQLGENSEILVRGPNVFPGYWNRLDKTAQVLRDGWFHTGDQGEVNENGNWRIVGRLKDLIILTSGHNVAPEPIEAMLALQIPDAQQVLLVGNNRSFLAAIVTGVPTREAIEAALAVVNPQLPHYKQVRAFYVHPEPFTLDNGLLTANGKLKRDAIAARLQAPIEELYRKKDA